MSQKIQEEVRAKEEDKAAETKRRPIRGGQFVRLVAFLLIVVLLFHFFTALYDRPVTRLVKTFREYPVDTIDVVTVGSSNVYRFLSPMEGWEKYGIASYSYGVAGARGDLDIFSLEEILKRQKPKIVMIEARSFITTRNSIELGPDVYRYLKNYTNPLERWRIVHSVCKRHGYSFSKDQLPYYLTLILNHENYWAIARPGNWKRALGKEGNHDAAAAAGQDGTAADSGPVLSYVEPAAVAGVAHETSADMDAFTSTANQNGAFNGYKIMAKIVQQPYFPYNSEIRTPLDPGFESALREIIEFCFQKGIQPIIVSSPFSYTDEDAGELNSIADIADEYQIPMLNANKDAEKIGMDYNTDFYNGAHTNLFGAIKYSRYVYDYLHENCDLPDRRGDEKYAEYDKTDKIYQTARQSATDTLNGVIAAMDAAEAAGAFGNAFAAPADNASSGAGAESETES